MLVDSYSHEFLTFIILIAHEIPTKSNTKIDIINQIKTG